MKLTRTIAATIAVCWLAPAVGAQTPPPTGQPRPTPQERPDTPTPRHTAGGDQQDKDHEFVRKAMEGNQKEIDLGTLAATRASHADVKAFANRMVQDHTKKLADLKAVAGARATSSGSETASNRTGSAAGTAPTNVPAKLANLQGAEFDRAYMAEMVDAHEDMVELLEDQSKDGDDARLKKWAADGLAGTREHLQMARSLRDKVKGT